MYFQFILMIAMIMIMIPMIWTGTISSPSSELLKQQQPESHTESQSQRQIPPADIWYNYIIRLHNIFALNVLAYCSVNDCDEFGFFVHNNNAITSSPPPSSSISPSTISTDTPTISTDIPTISTNPSAISTVTATIATVSPPIITNSPSLNPSSFPPTATPPTAPSPTPPVDNNQEAKFAKNFDQNNLDKHNIYRSNHSSPPLELNSTISSFAQEWANHCAQTRSIAHRDQSTYGENIYSFTKPTKEFHGEESVDDWYEEEAKYHWYNGEPPSSSFHDTGHFTQLIWKDSKQMGVGKAFNSDRSYLCVVVNYLPRGNVVGKYKDNVLPPKQQN